MSDTPKDRDRVPENKEMTKKSRTRTGAQTKRQHVRREYAGNARQDAAARRNSILIIILSVVVVVAIVAGVLVNLGRKESDTQVKDSAPQVDPNITVDANTNQLEENKYPAVNELIANYRKAFKEADTELLKQVYNSDEEINADILTATTQIIEDYQNTQYYTKRGLNSGEYVVFVYDELKLADINTLAPNLSVFYVKPKNDGSLYIYRGDYNAATGTFAYDETTQNYISELYKDEDVSELIATVNTKMDSACANDSDLMEFMQKVRSKTNVAPQTGQDTADTTNSETTGESSSEIESESETGSSADGEA